MPKVYIDVTDKRVSEQLKEAINNLSNIVNQSIDIPGDFAYRSQTMQYKNDINKIKNKLNNLNKWLINSQNDYQNLLNDLTSGVNKIKDINVKKNNSKIKE